MGTSSYIYAIGKRTLAAIVCALTLLGCDSVIYDGEGDCSVNYRVKFRYDMNLKFADAFAREVESVTLYLLDGGGRVVWQRTESGEALGKEGYAMEVDVAPGTYDLLAWCGSTDKGSFRIPESASGKELTCTLMRESGTDGTGHVREDLDRLYHGYLPNQTFGDTEGTYTYVVPLVKNTNNVRVVLQQTSGERLDEKRFSFRITAENGRMDWDNQLLPDEPVTYHAWHKQSATAGTALPDLPDAVTSVQCRYRRADHRTANGARQERDGPGGNRNESAATTAGGIAGGAQDEADGARQRHRKDRSQHPAGGLRPAGQRRIPPGYGRAGIPRPHGRVQHRMRAGRGNALGQHEHQHPFVENGLAKYGNLTIYAHVTERNHTHFHLSRDARRRDARVVPPDRT